jgi:hypothetical protein
MKYPGHYIKGAPHVPVVTLTSHFTGMCPNEDVSTPASEQWYRGDDYAAVVALAERRTQGLKEIVAIFEKENGDYELLDFLDIAERYLK